ncbi:hypothetical protein GGX14DRAFT_538652 [Mycena pura]|uniref:Peroxisome membrane anchor protein Pex14p N-terminal domain-containing protein n=1 Tax=Mycena pura TaxID=153505 RepID=A0AAD6YT16_9AGAR|nr:hypothetical protein GGX14DRAFT_538652 [Mycena pura]
MSKEDSNSNVGTATATPPALAPSSGSADTPQNVEPPTPLPPSVPPPNSESEDRTDLLAKARAFLHQPQVQREDLASKRRFLADKGLNEVEVEGLLREMPVQRPVVPPRSYPQPPPSNLPVLLLGVARLFSWLVGGAAALAFIYHRILLPRVTETSLARNSIKSHQLSLLYKLNTSLAALKESQTEVAAVMPKPESYKEPSVSAACASLDALLKAAEQQGDEVSRIYAVSLLRCAIADFRAGAGARNPNTAELFTLLAGKIPWLVSEEGRSFENHIWETLSTCPLFVSTASPSPDDIPEAAPPATDRNQEILYWSYTPPEPVPPTAILQSLSRLAATIPKSSAENRSPLQHALQAMTDFTGYISSQMYAPYVPMGTRFAPGVAMGAVEEEVRKEIRTLKGLVLNRRTFLPSPPVRSQ